MSSSQQPIPPRTQEAEDRSMRASLPPQKWVLSTSSKEFCNSKPAEEKKSRRTIMFNDRFDFQNGGHRLDNLSSSREIKYYENEYFHDWRNFLQDDMIKARDFVYVALVLIQSYQDQFINVFDNILEDYKNGDKAFACDIERTHKYYLFARTRDELVNSINTAVESHLEKDRRFKNWPLPNSGSVTVVKKDLCFINYQSYFDLIIYPNSRCLDCRRPVNPLLEKCELEENKTKTKTFIRCSTCIKENEQAEVDRLRFINNPKAASKNIRWQIYKEGDTKIHWKIVGEIEKWICHLCHEHVENSLPSTHPLAPTVDHVIPITKGGKHEWENVKLAHRSCNARKSNKFDERKLVGP
jgi:5-methylcytosine-specific restriction endonuclease McrA